MKTLGNRSVSSFLKKLVTILWYVEFLLLLTPPLVFLDDDGIRYSWPVTLTSVEVQPQIKPLNPKITDIKLQDRYNVQEVTRERMLSFDDSSLGRRLIQTLHNLVYIFLIMFITWQVKQILTGFSADEPFGNKNPDRIRWIAFSVLFLVFFDVFEDVLHRVYSQSTIALSGATFDWYNNSFDLRTLLLGLLLLIIAEVFKRGTEYKTDSESIL
jgi:hypothetical protein